MIDVVDAGWVAVWVAVSVAVLVTVLEVTLPVDEEELVAAAFVALEIAPCACFAALDAALLAALDPQPLTAAAPASTSATTITGRRTVDLIVLHLLVGRDRTQYGAHSFSVAPAPQ